MCNFSVIAFRWDRNWHRTLNQIKDTKNGWKSVSNVTRLNSSDHPSWMDHVWCDRRKFRTNLSYIQFISQSNPFRSVENLKISGFGKILCCDPTHDYSLGGITQYSPFSEVRKHEYFFFNNPFFTFYIVHTSTKKSTLLNFPSAVVTLF